MKKEEIHLGDIKRLLFGQIFFGCTVVKNEWTKAAIDRYV